MKLMKDKNDTPKSNEEIIEFCKKALVDVVQYSVDDKATVDACHELMAIVSFEAALNERAHLIGNLFDEAEPVEE